MAGKAKRGAGRGENPPRDMAGQTVSFLIQSGPQPKRLSAVFYRTSAGNEPVRDWLKMALSKGDRVRIGTDIRTVEYGWPVGMPTCRPLGDGLWEVRTELQNTIARILFIVSDNRMVLLHGFIKKARKASKPDLDLALRRKKDVETGR